MQSFNDYQKFTESLASYNEDVALFVGNQEMQLGFMYPLLALGEEAGEVQGKVAKFIRKSRQIAGDTAAVEQLRMDVGKELGDLQYQLSETARQFGFSLQEIVDMNVAKLNDRVDRGVLIGEGDNR